MRKQRKITELLFCLLLSGILLLNAAGCTGRIQAADLMETVQANTAEGKPADEVFLQNMTDFAIELFKNTADPEKNSLISPLSGMLALAMTANGAEGRTKAEMEAVLGGALSIEELNPYLFTYRNQLPSAEKYKLKIANSIWFRGDETMLQVEQDFLQKNADYYGAAAYRSAFGPQTVKDINRWVGERTDGMIEEIIDKIDDAAVMYLINALAFDAEWQRIYQKTDVYDGNFTASDGARRSVEMMRSDESVYLCDADTVGFLKPYRDGKYSFAALLPKENVPISDYIASLSGGKFRALLANAETGRVEAELPKFTYEYTVSLNKALKAMGMTDAFSADHADFSKLGNSSFGNIYIGDVLHKTFISVGERGTKAGAVTKVEMNAESAAPEDSYLVKLDRPFVYAIIDCSTQLPVFLGAVSDIVK